jgi:phage tail-like protein
LSRRSVWRYVIEYREGNDHSLAPRRSPGLNDNGDITLSRGVTTDSKLWQWREQATTGAVERHDISVSLLDDTGRPKITRNLYTCWPKTWAGPSLNATSDEVAIEQLTLAYERIEVDQRTAESPPGPSARSPCRKA